MEKKDYFNEYLKKWKNLDKIQDMAEKKCNEIKKTMPFCKPSKSFMKYVDIQIKIGEDKAKIWNIIRNKTFDGKTTLWQKALISDLPVKYFGKEIIINFTKQDIDKLIKREIKQKC